MLSLVCIAREVFFFSLGTVHVISTGPLSTVQTERLGILHPPRAERKLLLQALGSAWLNTIEVTRLL
ncbi:unnamed protein product [Staurois parvus]|uniref:Secreted protein n=1 Tax=Staurois parvus TaxID=386267 RepID=A0ABN9CM05_9NEOB|nr:unnamed protein product [Staurois parvus]